MQRMAEKGCSQEMTVDPKKTPEMVQEMWPRRTLVFSVAHRQYESFYGITPDWKLTRCPMVGLTFLRGHTNKIRDTSDLGGSVLIEKATEISEVA